VKSGIESAYTDGQREFKTVIKGLDAANARLESTMDVLRSTMAESALRPTGEEPRSLLDFIEESSIEATRDALKESIRESKDAQTEFDSSILAFDDNLRDLKTAIGSSNKTSSSRHTSPIPEHLNELETHAQEMALLLESLSRHFDLCVNAIRHTEGGYAAVRQAASNPEPGAEPVSVSGVMNAEENPHEEPLSEEERREMLDILENDAAEVEDVVIELRERLNDMELKHEAILEYVSSLANTYKEVMTAYDLLERVGMHLSGYIIASQDFRLRWEELKTQIQEQMEDLERIRVFYEGYYSSYNGLILEVYRRKQAEEKVKSIARKAMDQMEKVYEADMKEREGFQLDSGEYLPYDLYPGVNAAAPRWELREVGEKMGSTPDLDRTVVEAAARRDRERRREDHR